MRRIKLSSVASLLYPIFPRYYKLHNFRGKKFWNIKYVFWITLQLLSETVLTLRRIERDIKMYVGLHEKYRLFLQDFDHLNFLEIYENTQISKVIRIHPLGVEMFHTHGWTARHKANSRFSQFCEHAWNSIPLFYDAVCNYFIYSHHGAIVMFNFNSSYFILVKW